MDSSNNQSGKKENFKSHNKRDLKKVNLAFLHNSKIFEKKF